MALTYPLGLADFLDQLGIYETGFDLTEALTMNEDGGGELLPSSNGPRLWEGRVTVITDTHDEADRMVARVETIRDGVGSFMVTPTTRPAPIADPGGTILGGFTPEITGIGADMRSLSVGGLPAGYTLTARVTCCPSPISAIPSDTRCTGSSIRSVPTGPARSAAMG